MGKGISISVSAATDRKLTEATAQLCRDKGISHCIIAAPSSTGTNAATVNLVRSGVPVVDVGLPLASMHTYNEVISMTDAKTLTALVKEFIRSESIAEGFRRDKEMWI